MPLGPRMGIENAYTRHTVTLSLSLSHRYTHTDRSERSIVKLAAFVLLDDDSAGGWHR